MPTQHPSCERPPTHKPGGTEALSCVAVPARKSHVLICAASLGYLPTPAVSAWNGVTDWRGTRPQPVPASKAVSGGHFPLPARHPLTVHFYFLLACLLCAPLPPAACLPEVARVCSGCPFLLPPVPLPTWQVLWARASVLFSASPLFAAPPAADCAAPVLSQS